MIAPGQETLLLPLPGGLRKSWVDFAMTPIWWGGSELDFAPRFCCVDSQQVGHKWRQKGSFQFPSVQRPGETWNRSMEGPVGGQGLPQCSVEMVKEGRMCCEGQAEAWGFICSLSCHLPQGLRTPCIHILWKNCFGAL